ncbi:TetR/AcrR family transcriptional regulator [Mycolicibacterium litorale]|uniref:TetR family transcriptional regulator n=1 Tax=Mycolicibacterium litorale TaxID=758802 RepID=A0AAD1IQS2_9MYCO|nr:TetR/AcrR family transcriptional regulator [Mycolicibacterium litorale]MCV7418273.1 TetR/AcrR family transcriptional regulator [Mycolicibacterium litorale]TDY06334.1 TetR family transcriptional regulator [Mycolicibacterium litorale]BBY19519.1 TetR family transcriptional regulator [Mycolicibacterium litorale]
MPAAPARRIRADAQRNREALLRAARETFAADGIFAPIDGIATAAGLGNATLYRNFPTRDDLLAAVIEDSVCELLAESEAFERDLDADAALREWLYQLAWRLRIWHDLPTCIATAYDDDASPVQTVCARLTERTAVFLERLRREGGAAASVTADDLFQLVTAVSWAVDRFGDDPERARERVALATAGVFLR